MPESCRSAWDTDVADPVVAACNNAQRVPINNIRIRTSIIKNNNKNRISRHSDEPEFEFFVGPIDHRHLATPAAETHRVVLRRTASATWSGTFDQTPCG